MSYYKVTVTAYGMFALNDYLGLEAMAPEAQFTSVAGQNSTTTTFVVTGSVWERIRPHLRTLSQRRIPQVDPTTGFASASGKTQPAVTYTADPVPGSRPMITGIHPGSLSAGGAGTQNLTVSGAGLVAGLQASYTFYSAPQAASTGAWGSNAVPASNPPVAILQVTAVRKGPAGNLIALNISPASGAGSVTTTFGADGAITITVVPAAGQADSTHIAAQINGDAVAASVVSATAPVASQPIAATTNATYALGASASGQGQAIAQLAGGDGMGVAFLDLVGKNGTGRLHLEATLPGNQQNLVTLTVVLGQAGNSVVVTGTHIVVNRTEAAGTGVTLTNLSTAISGSAAAAALVTPSVVGSGADVQLALPTAYLCGGAGETPSATVGGVAATIAAMTDTSATIEANVTGILAAGFVATDDLELNIRTNYSLLTAHVPLAV